MDIKNVAIIGAGAIGAYFICGLRDKLGTNLWVVAEGDRKSRLEKEGLLVNGEKIVLNVKTPEEARGADLLLVSVKYGALRESLPAIRTIVDSHTQVMSLLNGVDSEEIVGEVIGKEHIIYSFMKIASQRVENSIVYDPEITQGVFMGEPDHIESERIKAVCRLFDGTGVRYTVSQEIVREIWYKYALNISKNIPQAILNCGFGAYRTSENVKKISQKMRDEVVAVAAAKGIDIRDENNPASSNSNVLSTARFSTLQDLDAGRHTEIDMLSGAMIRMGRELGIPVPFNEFAYYAVKALEEKNDGMFL